MKMTGMSRVEAFTNGPHIECARVGAELRQQVGMTHLSFELVQAAIHFYDVASFGGLEQRRSQRRWQNRLGRVGVGGRVSVLPASRYGLVRQSTWRTIPMTGNETLQPLATVADVVDGVELAFRAGSRARSCA